MKLCSIRSGGRIEAAVMLDEGVVRVSAINSEKQIRLPVEPENLISDDKSFNTLLKIYNAGIQVPERDIVPIDQVTFSPPMTSPPKIWCIGLNFREHAKDLNAVLPTEPASFMKPRTSIIGHRDHIVLPTESQYVTAEAELGIVMGKRVKNALENQARESILGVVPIIDMTAVDILQKNPRFLTRAKSFDTFFSFGPAILTLDEVGEFSDLRISTIKNSKVEHSNVVSNMTFPPEYLVSFHSRVFTFEPGDIISTGSPGAVEIKPGDVVQCRIDGIKIPTLENYVTGK